MMYVILIGAAIAVMFRVKIHGTVSTDIPTRWSLLRGGVYIAVAVWLWWFHK